MIIIITRSIVQRCFGGSVFCLRSESENLQMSTSMLADIETRLYMVLADKISPSKPLVTKEQPNTGKYQKKTL